MAEMQHSTNRGNGGSRREALLLDRDGVINVDKQFVSRRENFEWRDGIFRLVAAAAERTIPIIVVTNQTGIGRGYYTAEEFDKLTTWMLNEFAQRNTPITKVYHCPHHPQATIPELRADHSWRKPKPGMILAAQAEFGLDLAHSVMIGDQWNDMFAAHAAGVGTAVLVGEPRPPTPVEPPPVVHCRDVEAAAQWYEGHLRHRLEIGISGQ